MVVNEQCSYRDGLLNLLNGTKYNLFELHNKGSAITLRCNGSEVRYIPGVYEPSGNMAVTIVTGNDTMILDCDKIVYPWYDYNYPIISITQEILKKFNKTVSYKEADYFVKNCGMDGFLDYVANGCLDGTGAVSVSTGVDVLNKEISDIIPMLCESILIKGRVEAEENVIDILFGKYTYSFIYNVVITGQSKAVGCSEFEGCVIPTLYGVPITSLIRASNYRLAGTSNEGVSSDYFKGVDFTNYLK